MSLTNPWALALLAVAAPIVYAYLFRRSNEKVPVASTILLRAIRDEQPAAQRARARIRHRVSLALVLAALLLVLAALVGPAPGGGGHRYVVVLDTSASMATRADDGGDRLGRAADAIAALARRLGRDDELALVVTGAEPGVRVPPTRTHADVVAQVRSLAGEGAAGDNRDDALAFALADGLCRDAARTTVLVVSDGAGLAAPPVRCKVAHVALGAPADNVGIAALAARSVDGMGAYDVHVAVASTAGEARDVEVNLAVGGSIVDVLALRVPAGGDAEETVRITVGRGQELTASLGGAAADALPLDDRATVALPDDAPVSVLLVSSSPKSLLAEALALHPRVRLTRAAPDAIPTAPVHLVVLEHAPAGPLPPAARVVGFGAAPPGAPIQLGATATDRGVVRWDYEAPWFRYVDLRDVFIAAARHVVGGRPIVDSASGPLAATARWDDRELVVIGFGGAQSDLTLRPAFPNLVANLVDWAGDPVRPERGGALATPGRRTHGVLSAAESHVDPAPLPGVAFAAPGRWSDTRWLLRLAIVLAIALLLAEQLWMWRARRVA